MGTLSKTGTGWRFTSFWLLALSALVLGCDPTAGGRPPSTAPGAPVTDIDPDVAKLLELTVQDKALRDFVNRLEALAKRQGWRRQLVQCKERLFSDWEEARAVLVGTGKSQYVVVLLKSSTFTIPGDEMEAAILLDRRGKLLDQLACEINSRLTEMGSGRFHTVVPSKPETDGAQLVIRLDGVSVRGNFDHHIDHGGKDGRFYWGCDQLPQDQPTKWDTKGLCRIAIQNGKFAVLFPGAKDGEKIPFLEAAAPNNPAEAVEVPGSSDGPAAVPIQQLAIIFQTNELRAQELYVDKELNVKGEVQRVIRSRKGRRSSNAPQEYVVELRIIPRRVSDITLQFFFKQGERDKLVKLQAGQVVVIRGRCNRPIIFGAGRGVRKDYIEVPFSDCKLVGEK